MPTTPASAAADNSAARIARRGELSAGPYAKPREDLERSFKIGLGVIARSLPAEEGAGRSEKEAVPGLEQFDLRSRHRIGRGERPPRRAATANERFQKRPPAEDHAPEERGSVGRLSPAASAEKARAPAVVSREQVVLREIRFAVLHEVHIPDDATRRDGFLEGPDRGLGVPEEVRHEPARVGHEEIEPRTRVFLIEKDGLVEMERGFLPLAELGGDDREVARDLDRAPPLARSEEEPLRLGETLPRAGEIVHLVRRDAEVIENGDAEGGIGRPAGELEGGLELVPRSGEVHAPQLEVPQARVEAHGHRQAKRCLPRRGAKPLKAPSQRLLRLHGARVQREKLAQLGVDRDQVLQIGAWIRLALGRLEDPQRISHLTGPVVVDPEPAANPRQFHPRETQSGNAHDRPERADRGSMVPEIGRGLAQLLRKPEEERPAEPIMPIGTMGPFETTGTGMRHREGEPQKAQRSLEKTSPPQHPRRSKRSLGARAALAGGEKMACEALLFPRRTFAHRSQAGRKALVQPAHRDRSPAARKLLALERRMEPIGDVARGSPAHDHLGSRERAEDSPHDGDPLAKAGRQLHRLHGPAQQGQCLQDPPMRCRGRPPVKGERDGGQPGQRLPPWEGAAAMPRLADGERHLSEREGHTPSKADGIVLKRAFGLERREDAAKDAPRGAPGERRQAASAQFRNSDDRFARACREDGHRPASLVAAFRACAEHGQLGHESPRLSVGALDVIDDKDQGFPFDVEVHPSGPARTLRRRPAVAGIERLEPGSPAPWAAASAAKRLRERRAAPRVLEPAHFDHIEASDLRPQARLVQQPAFSEAHFANKAERAGLSGRKVPEPRFHGIELAVSSCDGLARRDRREQPPLAADGRLQRFAKLLGRGEPAFRIGLQGFRGDPLELEGLSLRPTRALHRHTDRSVDPPGEPMLQETAREVEIGPRGQARAAVELRRRPGHSLPSDGPGAVCRRGSEREVDQDAPPLPLLREDEISGVDIEVEDAVGVEIGKRIE